MIDMDLLKSISGTGITRYLNVHSTFYFLVYHIDFHTERKKKTGMWFLPCFQFPATLFLLM